MATDVLSAECVEHYPPPFEAATYWWTRTYPFDDAIDGNLVRDHTWSPRDHNGTHVLGTIRSGARSVEDGGHPYRSGGAASDTKTDALVDRFILAKRAQGVSSGQIENYRWAFAYLPDPLPQTPEPLEFRLAELAETLAAESRRDLHRIWRTFYAFLSARDGAPNPMLAIPKPRKSQRFPSAISEKEILAIWDACEDDTDRAIFAVALGTGLRVGEIAGLGWGDIGLREITVRDGKTGARYVPLPPSVAAYIEPLRQQEYPWLGKTGYRHGGKRLTNSGMQQRIRRIMAYAGIEPPGAGAHALRHTFASMFIRNGGSVFALQSILGHASIETTMIYVHMNRDDLFSDMERFSPASTFPYADGEVAS